MFNMVLQAPMAEFDEWAEKILGEVTAVLDSACTYAEFSALRG